MKDYKNWTQIKTELEGSQKRFLFHERKIWWCSIGENIGDEQDGKNNFYERPILILKKFNHEIFFGLPLTSKLKDSLYYIGYESENIHGAIILSQGKLFSQKRLQRKITKMGRGRFGEIKERLRKLFE